MERTYILGNGESLKQLGGTFIEIPPFNINEEAKIHDWIVQLFDDSEIEKIVIEVDNNPNLSLQIGLHIRLSIEDLREKALVPILFLSQLTLNSVIQQTEVNSHILATKGVIFSEFNINENRKELELLQGLHENEYLTGFLKRINIQPDESIGRHSLANIWGAYALDKAANAFALPPEADFKKKLYFKYISAFNNLDKLTPSRLKVLGNINVGNVKGIDSEKRRILLIDDEANKGWAQVLRKIFRTSSEDDFVVISEKVRDYDSLTPESKKMIESDGFDLYLIDLRLNGLEEDDNIETREFSGMKVLKKIKSINEGNQVIVFSASNKIWNLKALLEAGADGYYLKESPELKFSNSISEQKFEEFRVNVSRCFEKNYLKELYLDWKNAFDKSGSKDSNFLKESRTSLELAWQLLKREYLDFGFLTLFQAIESRAQELYLVGEYQDSLESEVVINKSDTDKYEWIMTFKEDPNNGSYFISENVLSKSSQSPTTLYKVSCLFKIKYSVDDVFLKRLGRLNKIRNRIAHKGAKNIVSVDDVKELFELLSKLRTH